VPRLVDLPGRLVPTRVAEVRAQVAGIIQERAFAEAWIRVASARARAAAFASTSAR
jgi:multidrug efflux pump subunit AcrA (membrane-fusion protein)